jgi:hypothetical protein
LFIFLRHMYHPRSQALFLSLLEGEKAPGWGWSRGSQNLGGNKYLFWGRGHKSKNMHVSCVKLNKTVTLMDPSLNHILCSEPRDQPQPGSFSSSKGKEPGNEDARVYLTTLMTNYDTVKSTSEHTIDRRCSDKVDIFWKRTIIWQFCQHIFSVGKLTKKKRKNREKNEME